MNTTPDPNDLPSEAELASVSHPEVGAPATLASSDIHGASSSSEEISPFASSHNVVPLHPEEESSAAYAGSLPLDSSAGYSSSLSEVYSGAPDADLVYLYPPADDVRCAGVHAEDYDSGFMRSHSEDSGAPPEIIIEPEPAGVADFFGFQTNAMRYFVELLCLTGLDRGLVGPKEPARIWSRHILNCATLSQFLPEEAKVADVGSGAGLPGLVLAISRPDLELTLIESMERRCLWLEWAVAELDLDNVRVLHSRAEDLHGKERFPYVTARAVGNLGKLLSWVAPLVRPKGTMLFLKGASVAAEVESAKKQNLYRKHHVTFPEIFPVETPVTGETTHVARLTKHS